MIRRIGITCLVVAGASLTSMMAFPPGDVPRQISIAALWLVTGIILDATWANRSEE